MQADIDVDINIDAGVDVNGGAGRRHVESIRVYAGSDVCTLLADLEISCMGEYAEYDEARRVEEREREREREKEREGREKGLMLHAVTFSPQTLTTAGVGSEMI